MKRNGIMVGLWLGLIFFSFFPLSSYAESIFVGWKSTTRQIFGYPRTFPNGDAVSYTSSPSQLHHYIASEDRWVHTDIGGSIIGDEGPWGNYYYIYGNTTPSTPFIKRYNIQTQQMENVFNASNLSSYFQYPTDRRTRGMMSFSMYGEDGSVLALIGDSSLERVMRYNRNSNSWFQIEDSSESFWEIEQVVAAKGHDWVLYRSDGSTGYTHQYELFWDSVAPNRTSRDSDESELVRTLSGGVMFGDAYRTTKESRGFLDRKNNMLYYIDPSTNNAVWKAPLTLESDGTYTGQGTQEYIGPLDVTGGSVYYLSGGEGHLLVYNGGILKEASILHNWSELDIEKIIEEKIASSPTIQDILTNITNLQKQFLDLQSQITNLGNQIMEQAPTINKIRTEDRKVTVSTSPVSFIIEQENGVEYRYRLDEGSWSTWKSASNPLTVSVPISTPGMHIFYVQLRKAANGEIVLGKMIFFKE